MYLILMELIKTIITSLGKNSVNNLKYKNFNKQLFTSISPELETSVCENYYMKHKKHNTI